MPYYIINENNIVMGYSDVDGPDKTFIDKNLPSCDPDREDLKVVNGEIVTVINNEKKKYFEDNIYKKNRISAFPSIGDQLDMQYHDELNGTTTWKDAVAKVKSDNPKG